MSSMTTSREREAGIVSIMVTMVTIVVISLIVLGFADIARNEQRTNLDQQLSVQAYYAAESGVNDARAAIDTLINTGQSVPDKTSCGNDTNYTFDNNGTIDDPHSVAYTCLLITASTPTLTYDIGYKSTVIPLLSNAGSGFGVVTLSWGTASGGPANLNNCTVAPGNFPAAPQWQCGYPVLRVDLLNANGSLARTSWNTNTATDFFIPQNSNNAPSASLNDRGRVIGVGCKNACTVKYPNLGGTKYYMRVTTLYQTNSRLTITASSAKFTGAEALIDATGKAQDVLRRIVVAVDLTDANAHSIPSNALVVEDSICKRFGIDDNTFSVDQDYGAGGEGNPLCQKH